MPGFKRSKSQKRSQSQSKNGGRRRKRTLKNVRRRKSRKVMRGGEDTPIPTPYVASLSNKSAKLYNILLLDKTIINKDKLEDLIYNSATYNDYVVKGWYNDLFDTYPPDTMKIDDVRKKIVENLEAGYQI